MNTEDLQLIGTVWHRLLATPFAASDFAKLIRRHGGHDMFKVSEDDIMRLMQGHFTGNWKNVGFAFSELLAYYAAPDDPQSKEQAVGWMFASLVVMDAIHHGVLDCEIQFNLFIDGFVQVRKNLKVDEAIYVFQRIFGSRDSSTGKSESTAP